jgi:hypothetical protein
MAKNDLRRLRRQDLLEMLVELSEENRQLREKMEQLEEQLQDRTIRIEKAGSLADAAMQLTGIFQSAEEACGLYIHNTRLRCQELEEKTRARCQELLEQAQAKEET